MSIVLPFPAQPRKTHGTGPVSHPSELPSWLQYFSEGDARHYMIARARVIAALVDFREDPHPSYRAGFRDQIAGAVHVCAVKTDIDIDFLIGEFATLGELTAEEMASRHMGRTPWRKRILREEKLARKAARRSPALH